MQQVQSQLPGVDCVAISSMSDEGVAPLRPWLRPSSTLVFLGPSGAGKSTLVNRLAGAALMRTGVVADDGRGKHTTTHRALITLPDDVTVIDTPGLREVGMWVGSAGSEHLFADIMGHSAPTATTSGASCNVSGAAPSVRCTSSDGSNGRSAGR
ncbi:MAG: GTPase RsgA [Gemmatimonadetes bacterium]|nr:GTPase RsgA [Gemmatimonadota bacterium]